MLFRSLPTPTIANGALYNAATLYTGTGASNTIANSQSNGGNNPLGKTFYADFVWVKGRSGATSHNLSDSVRGTASTLFSNTTGATVELFNTDGAQGAARAAGLGAGIFKNEKEAFSGLKILQKIF